MAEPGVSDRHLGEFENEITCVLCHGHYKEAKLLPCMHCYCRTCIEELCKKLGQPFPCPECQKDTTLPSGGAEQLQSAFYVDRMKDLYEKMAKAEGKMEAMCEQCSTGEAVAFCRHCTEFICAECVRQHQKLKVFSGHRVTTLEDLRSGGELDTNLKEVPPPKCTEHDEPMTIFCFKCKYLICPDCMVYDHCDHKSDLLKKCATKSRKSLSDSLAQLQNVQSNISVADERVNATIDQVEAQKKEICQTTEESFGKLKAVLQHRKRELLNEVMTLVQEKRDILTAQRKCLQMAVREIQRLVEFVKQNVENTSNQDLMLIRTQLHAKIKKEEKCHQLLSLKPATAADIMFNSPSPDTVPKDLGKLFHQPLLEIGDVSHFQLGKPFNVTLKVPVCSMPTIAAKLKSLVDPALSVKADIIQKRVGVYSITITPRVRGRHDLTVKVNSKDVVRSPLRVFVHVHPSQLGHPVQTISGVVHPWGIALNSKQQLVVVESSGKKVSVMERDGRRVQTIECDKFQWPCGVATGPDETIYVVDSSAQCLFEFNKCGRLLKIFQNELKCPKFIKNIKNQLFVSDHTREVVTVFDTNCNVKGNISTKECSKPYDIAEGDDGLYVAGKNKICVYTCAPKGNFIRHVNIKSSSVKLCDPGGICFDHSGHLFVTQTGCGGNGVYVFKPSGEHVPTIGLAGSEVWVECPTGIAIDKDGYVYVCDASYNGKIVVF